MDAHLAFRGVGGPRLHLGVCGSVAAYRALDLVRQWQDAGVSVSATLTPSAQKFVTPLTFAALGAAPVYTAPFDDPQAPSPFAHLEPGQVAQALVIAPASAATIARLAQGQADNTVFVADASGREERWAHLSKTDVAWRLLSWLLSR